MFQTHLRDFVDFANLRGMKHVLGVLLFSLSAWSQAAQTVNQVSAPPPDVNVRQYFQDGSGNLIYVCIAPQDSPSNANQWSVALSNLTNIVVLTNVGTINFTSTSYLWVGQQITIAGSATTALNGTYKVTAVTGTTATIATSGVGNATYTDMAITTRNPVLNQAVWAIQALTYSGTTLTGSYWALSRNTPNGLLACSNRANY